MRFVPHKSGTPLVGTNNVAISAACHAKETERDNLDTPLPEQDLGRGMVSIADDGVEHCALSSGAVEAPWEEHLYA